MNAEISSLKLWLQSEAAAETSDPDYSAGYLCAMRAAIAEIDRREQAEKEKYDGFCRQIDEYLASQTPEQLKVELEGYGMIFESADLYEI